MKKMEKMKKMKKTLKRWISTIAVLSMIATMAGGFSMTASASAEYALVTAVGDAKWAEVYNKKLIDVMTPDDGPKSPEWDMATSYGSWTANPEAVKLSFDVLDNNLVFGKAGGDAQVITTLTDSMLNGDFIIDVKCAMLGKLTSVAGDYWPLEFRFDGHCFITNPGNTGKPLSYCFGPSKIYMSMSNMDYYNTYVKFRDSYPSGVSPTEKSDAPYNYCYLRLVVDNSLSYHKIRPFIKLNEADNWTATYIDDWTVANLKLLDNNNKIQIRANDSRTIVDSVKIYKKVSDIDDDYIVNDFDIEQENDNEYKVNLDITNVKSDDAVKLYTAVYEVDGDSKRLAEVNVEDVELEKEYSDNISKTVTLPQDGKSYVIKAFLWKAGSLSPLSGVLPLEQ